MREFEINLVPFNIINDEVTVYFSKVEKVNYCRLFKNDLPKNMPINISNNLDQFIWWTSKQNNEDTEIVVKLGENRRFAKHYFNLLLYEHFFAQNMLINRNFIKDTEIYLEDFSFPKKEYKKYNKFTLRIDNNDLIEGTSLLLSYDGDSFIFDKNAEELQIDTENLTKLKYKRKITKYKFLTEAEKAEKKNIYPILNREIRAQLNLPYERNYCENPYKKYYELITKFYQTYLKAKIIDNCIVISESGFYKPYEGSVNKTSEDSNLLLFGDNQNNFIPYTGLKEYGPIKGLANKQVKFIFIFHENDKDYANKLFSYLKKGYKSFPGLESFVGINFQIDTENTIRFREINPFIEIKNAIQNIHLDEQTSYAAIYISRISKDSDDEEQDEVYYKVKELLLQYHIVSQVIDKEKIDNPSFNYFLPNIAIALLAKLGGIPWRLYRPIKNDLVIGIGADRSSTTKNRFVGNAIYFQNNGEFKGFNAFEKSDIEAIASSIKQAIEQYIEKNKGFDRLIIHYYKKMSYEEEQPIRDILDHLDLSIPLVTITINDTLSKDFVLFDSIFEGKMPQSGSFIKVKNNEYLLCNNTRYSLNTGTKIDGFPFPIKIHLKSSNYEKVNNIDVVRELIDQVYQFTRMYWKSVRQRNMPVTIEYSEMVAKMIAHFDVKELNSFAQNSLWFL